jgi:hypothetical protein
MRRLVPLLTLLSLPALADDDSYSGETLVIHGTPSDVAEGWIVPPGGTGSLDTQLMFLSASGIAFTDVGITRLHGDYSIKGRLELTGGAELLIKEPSASNEAAFQRGDLAARLRLGQSWAISAGAEGGPLMGGAGKWGEAEAMVSAKSLLDELDDTLLLEANLGLAATDLLMDARDPFVFAEIVADAKVELRAPCGMIAGWIGADYHGPIARSAGAEFDPRVRLGFDTGIVYAVAPSWDLYLQFDVVDRGDLKNPQTTLPILDGGFDQRQFVVGLTKHWPARRR